MPIVPLVLFAALAAVPAVDADPTALVAKLGSGDSAERALATESLKALGRTTPTSASVLRPSGRRSNATS
jgi:hypothetical protein